MKNDSKKTPTLPATQTESQPVKNLDDLIEILDQDALRNVVGGVRPKGRPA
ncbi:MAG: hypothetical protein JNK45_26365 [Myxococcales bacterium]|nr:hypothetical protein [Myxococcales bacterium]